MSHDHRWRRGSYLLREHVLLRLQCVAVLQALVAAGLGVAAVLQRPPLLLEAHHLVLAHAAQVPVELPHRQAHQLLVGEAIVEPALPMEGWKESFNVPSLPVVTDSKLRLAAMQTDSSGSVLPRGSQIRGGKK